jgi:membrane protease YdiL (CAAX protease family)
MAGIAPITLRDRMTSLLRDHRLLILAELVMVVLVRLQVLLPFSPATIPLLLLGSLSLWLRQSGWRQIGLDRPASWRRTIVAGVGIAVAWTALDWWLVLPLLKRITGQSVDLSEYAALPGNPGMLLVWVALSWTLAAFGEEMVYRGYLLNRLADLLGRTKAGWALSLVVMGLLFGWGHNFQGTTGLVMSLYDGIVLGVLYLASGRNLWLTVIEHGAGNTLGFILIYLGVQF